MYKKRSWTRKKISES